MSHQPFENWILERNATSSKERRLLEDHLVDCEECRKLYYGLNGFEKGIRNSKPIAIPEGFNDRWRARFQQNRLAANRKQTVKFIIIMFLLGALSFSALVFYLATNFTIGDAFISLTRVTVALFNATAQIQLFLRAVLSSPIGIPVVVTVVGLVFIGISFISSVWITFLWRFSIKGVS